MATQCPERLFWFHLCLSMRQHELKALVLTSQNNIVFCYLVMYTDGPVEEEDKEEEEQRR